MAYLDNKDKIRGKDREPIIAKRILDDFKLEGLRLVIPRKSNIKEDTENKFDYEFLCGDSESFSLKEKVNSIKVDIKSGNSFTLVDTRGRNTLENSKSDFIVFELYENAEKLLWVNTESLKQCLKKNSPMLKESKYENGSQYFFIESYLKEYKDKVKYSYR